MPDDNKPLTMTVPEAGKKYFDLKCDDTALLTAITEKPIQMVAERIKPEVAGVGAGKKNEHQPHASRSPMHG